MNHTGVSATGSLRQAARKGESMGAVMGSLRTLTVRSTLRHAELGTLCAP
jgi:hypothetical protein